MKLSACLPSASPLPTAAPLLDLVQHRLEVRQDIYGSTCGYYNANSRMYKAASMDSGGRWVD